jgi:hypothetical protein
VAVEVVVREGAKTDSAAAMVVRPVVNREEPLVLELQAGGKAEKGEKVAREAARAARALPVATAAVLVPQPTNQEPRPICPGFLVLGHAGQHVLCLSTSRGTSCNADW